MRPKSKNNPMAAANQREKRREFPHAEDGQHYCVCTKMLGGGRLMAKCPDGVERLSKIRGAMRRSERIAPGDLILVSPRPFQPDKLDVLWRYLPTEARLLRRWGEVPDTLAETVTSDDAEADGVVFEEDEEDMITNM